MKRFLLAIVFAVIPATFSGAASTPEYSIQAIRYATAPGFPLSEMLVGGPQDEKVDLAMVVWLIRGGGHTILFDSGYHRDTFLKDFTMNDYLRPDEAVKSAGVQPAALGSFGRHRSFPESDRLDSEGRISLLHHGCVAARW